MPLMFLERHMAVTIVREIKDSTNQMKYTANSKRPVRPKQENTKVIPDFQNSDIEIGKELDHKG